MEIVFGAERGRSVRGKLMFCRSEVKLVMVHVAAALESLPGFAFIGDKPVETRAQKRLKAGFASVVGGEVILFESVGEEALREILGVFVICAPLQADVFVCGFPVARENRVERATADVLIVAAGVDDGGVISGGKSMCWSANIGIWVHDYKIYRINRMFLL